MSETLTRVLITMGAVLLITSLGYRAKDLHVAADLVGMPGFVMLIMGLIMWIVRARKEQSASESLDEPLHPERTGS